MNRNVEHTVERRDEERISVANFTVPNMSLIEYDRAIKSLTKKLSDTLELSVSDSLVTNPCPIDSLLDRRGKIHLLVTSQENDNHDVRQLVAPLVSKLFFQLWTESGQRRHSHPKHYQMHSLLREGVWK